MARSDLHQRIREVRAQRVAHGHVPLRRTVGRRDGVRMEVDGRWLTGFCSNDYLGLSQQFEVVAALQDGASRDGVGATAPPLASGHHVCHDALAREVADWLGYPRALLFANGFMANLAVQQALLTEEDDVCVQDRLNHLSLLDATHLAGARLRRYPHLDTEGALRQLKGAADGAAMLATNAIFGVDGDTAPLRALSLVARMQQAVFYVDDAHGIGVVGPQGRGCVADAGLGIAEVPLQLVTLGKALGCHGALVVGDDVLIQHLSETATPYLCTTAMPPAQAAAALAAVKLARRDEWRRERLGELVTTFRDGARRHGLELMPSETPIQPLLCGDEATTMAIAASLENAGFLVAAVGAGAVADGRARLRVTLSALHAQQQVNDLVDAIARARDIVQRQRQVAALEA